MENLLALSIFGAANSPGEIKFKFLAVNVKRKKIGKISIHTKSNHIQIQYAHYTHSQLDDALGTTISVQIKVRTGRMNTEKKCRTLYVMRVNAALRFMVYVFKVVTRRRQF